MASANINTTNLGFDGTKLRIFDKIGFKSGENWVINALGCFVEVDPSTVSKDIIGIINADIDAGNFGKIDHISLKPHQLLGLYLEGVLSVSSIIHAEDRESVIIFRGVQFKTSDKFVNFPVWVSEDYQMATIDANGDIV